LFEDNSKFALRSLAVKEYKLHYYDSEHCTYRGIDIANFLTLLKILT